MKCRITTRQLRLELKTWRKVFWRLWGICHAFVCCLCGQPFQVSRKRKISPIYSFPTSSQFYMLEFCSYHPSEPEFPAIQFKNSTLPLGEFPCCGEAAVRFQPISQVPNNTPSPPESAGATLSVQASEGCKYRDHKVKVRNPKDSEMYLTLMAHRWVGREALSHPLSLTLHTMLNQPLYL